MDDLRFVSLVPKSFSCCDLLSYLSERFDYFNTSQWQAMLAQGRVFIDDEVANAQSVVHAQQRISFSLDYQQQLAREHEVDTNWQIVWQNDALLLVHKPAGMPVSRTGEVVINTLINLVRKQSPFTQAQLLNRLDRETSGLVLLAKDQKAAQYYSPKLNSLLVEKQYLALVEGQVSWQAFDHSCRLGELPQGDLGADDIRCQMHPLAYPAGKFCRARFQRMGYVQLQQQNMTVLKVSLITGRKHQIRAQLKSLGHSIVGDKIYAHAGQFYLKRLHTKLTQDDLRQLIYPHHCLFAWRLVLNLDGEFITVENPYQPDFMRHFKA